MTELGVNMDGVTFQWDLEEKLSTEQQFTIDKELMKFFTVPADYIEKMYGTPVEPLPEGANAAPAAQFTVMNDVASMYKGFFKSQSEESEC